MSAASNSASYPPELLQIMLRIGGDQSRSVSFCYPTASDAVAMRQTFYNLRRALKRERYDSLTTVAAVRFLVRLNVLTIEGSHTFTNPAHNTAIASMLDQLDSADDCGHPHSANPATTACPARDPDPLPSADEQADDAALDALANAPFEALPMPDKDALMQDFNLLFAPKR